MKAKDGKKQVKTGRRKMNKMGTERTSTIIYVVYRKGGNVKKARTNKEKGWK